MHPVGRRSCRTAWSECHAGCGSHPRRGSAGNREAALETGWWPRVLKISDHPFSREATQRLNRELIDPSPALLYLFSTADAGEEIPWSSLFPPLLALATERFRDRPERTGELARLAIERDPPELVRKLTALLRADAVSNLPTAIQHDGHPLRLAQVLSNVRPTQVFERGGSEVRLECGLALQDGHLAMALSGQPGTVCRIVIELDGTTHDALQMMEAEPEVLLTIRRGEEIGITISSEKQPTAIAIGMYA